MVRGDRVGRRLWWRTQVVGVVEVAVGGLMVVVEAVAGQEFLG